MDSVLESMRSTKSETTGQSATKTCTVCEQSKPLAAFSRDKQKADGLYPHCKECNRINTERRKRYRVEFPEPIDQKCQCCGKQGDLVVDHCHKTQEFRGWICKSCNHGLGKLGDDIENVLNALNYLSTFHKLGQNQETNDDLAAA